MKTPIHQAVWLSPLPCYFVFSALAILLRAPQGADWGPDLSTSASFARRCIHGVSPLFAASSNICARLLAHCLIHHTFQRRPGGLPFASSYGLWCCQHARSVRMSASSSAQMRLPLVNLEMRCTCPTVTIFWLFLVRRVAGSTLPPTSTGESHWHQAAPASHGLYTLLEEAIACPTSQAFFLAVTLVETLEEHFGHSGSGVCETPRRLSLEHCVPITTHQRDSLALSDIIPAAAPAFDQGDWLDADIRPVFSMPGLKPHLRELFGGIAVWPHHSQMPSPHSIAIYTDGSATEAGRGTPCSWAFTVWFYVHAQPFLYGTASSTAVPAHTTFHAGECYDNAVTAELLALFWAFTWAAQYAPVYQVPVAFYYDATSVGRGSFGASRIVQYPVSPQGVCLPKAFSVLRHLCGARCVLSHHHVQGHSGHSANELTDRLADLAARREEPYHDRCLPEWSCRLVCHPLADWAWLDQAPQADLPTVFAFESEAHRLQRHPELPHHAPKAGLVHHSSDQRKVMYQWTSACPRPGAAWTCALLC